MGKFSDFDTIKKDGYTNVLKFRGEKQRSGVSYDYMDKLNEFTEKGIFVDANGDGFTNAEKRALEDEFYKIHKEHNYSTDFDSMMPGTKTEYSYEDFIRLAKAAGYVLKEEPKVDIPVKEKEQTVLTPKNYDSEKKEVGLETKKSAEDEIIAGIEADSELAGKTAEEKIEILRNRQSRLYKQRQKLEKQTETYQTKGFLGLFKKTKERKLTEQEKAERQAKIPEIDKEYDNTEKMLAYVKQVEANEYWVDHVGYSLTLEDEKGNIVKEYPAFREVILIAPDGSEKKALRVEHYHPETASSDYTYYSVDIQKVGSPKYKNGPYYSIVPDLNNELKGYKDPALQ